MGGWGGSDEGDTHTRIDWSCRSLGSASEPPSLPFFPQLATDAGTMSRVRNFCFVPLNSGVEIVTPFSGSVPEPAEQGSVHWPGVGDGGLRTPEYSSRLLNPEIATLMGNSVSVTFVFSRPFLQSLLFLPRVPHLSCLSFGRGVQG